MAFTPMPMRGPMRSRLALERVYDYKITALEAMIAANADDAALVAAYRAQDRQGAWRQVGVRHDAAFQQAARQHVEAC